MLNNCYLKHHLNKIQLISATLWLVVRKQDFCCCLFDIDRKQIWPGGILIPLKSKPQLVQSSILLMSEWFSVASDPTAVLRINHFFLFPLLGLLFVGTLSKRVFLWGALGPHHNIWNVFTMLNNFGAFICHFNFNLIRQTQKRLQQLSVLLLQFRRPYKTKTFSTCQDASLWLETSGLPSPLLANR